MTTEETIAALDRGEIRVAEPDGDGWKVNYFGPRGTNPPIPAQRP